MSRKRQNHFLVGPGCGQCLPEITKNKDLIHSHMLDCEECKALVEYCKGCNTYYSKYSDYKKHVDRTRNQKCRSIFNSKLEKESYCTTLVEVPKQSLDAMDKNYITAVDNVSDTKPTDLELIHMHCLHSVSKCPPVLSVKDTSSKVVNEIILSSDDEDDIDDEDNDLLSVMESDIGSIMSEDQLFNEISESICSTNVDASPLEVVEGNDLNEDSSMLENIQQTLNPYNDVTYQTVEHYHEKLFLDMKKKQVEEISISSDDRDYMSSIKLLKILFDNKIGLSHYDEFMQWKNEDSKNKGQFLTLNRLMDIAIEKTYGKSLATGLKPVVKEVNLPSQKRCSMITFDISSKIYDLLNDEELTQSSNMIFEEKDGNPFHVPHSDRFEDIQTSLLYTRTMLEEEIDTTKEILCPIALYVDELKLDAFGKLGLEPIVLTLLIYNRETRNHHKAHRVIGYMPNFSRLFGHKSYTADQKANDYHHCLSIVTDEIKKFQNKRGFEWNFKLRNHPDMTFRRKLKFPLFYVIGDAKGNDMLAGRYGSRNNTRCIARDCDILLDDCDNPNKKCIFHRECIMNTKTKEELSQLSFRKLDRNAFKGMWFGSQPYGLFAALPPEPLHVFNLGIVERLAFSYMQRLSIDMIKILDRHVGYICTFYSKQSDRDYPNMETFSNGMSDAKRLTGKEKLARIFCIYVTMLTSDYCKEIVGKKGRHLSDNNLHGVIDQQEYNNWIKVFEETLLLASWIYCDSHPKVLFNGGRNSIVAKRIQQFMKMYSKNAPRKEGKQLKLLKFHHLLHLWWVIRLFGCLLNVDGARGESNNQYLAKYMGKATQKQHATLNYQTGKNSFKRDLFLKAFHKIYPQQSIPTSNNFEHRSFCGSKFKLVFDYERNTVTSEWNSWKMKSRCCKYSPLILQAVFEKLKYYNGGQIGRKIYSIIGHTELNFLDSEGNRDILRSCPTFRSSRHWHDWINVVWDNEQDKNILPAQILIMLDAATINYVASNDQMSQIAHTKISFSKLAFIHSSNGNRPSKTMPIVGGGGYASSMASWISMENHYQMVDIDTFHSKCFIVVDLKDDQSNNEQIGLAKRVISLIPKKDWNKKFIDYTSEANQSSSIVDDSITDYDLRFFEG